MKASARRIKLRGQGRVGVPAGRESAAQADDVTAHRPERKSERDHNNNPLSRPQPVNPAHKPKPITLTRAALGKRGGYPNDLALAVAAAIALIYETAELNLLQALTWAVRKSVPFGAVTMAGLAKLRRQVAAVMAAAEQRARRLLDRVGVAWDYRPILPTPGATPDLSQLGGVEPPGQLDTPADVAAITGQQTGPSLRDMYASIAAQVYRNVPDIYQTAVIDATAESPGGLPVGPYSAERIRMAQKALDTLTDHGITGFTDRAGRNWDLLAYVEMATRTAVSNAYDNVLNAVMLNAGHDLIWTFSHSTEGSCPLCIPWLGRVLSLTGSTTGPVSIVDAGGQRVSVDVAGTLNEARAAGFRHPNCRCGWVPFHDGADLTPPVPSAEAQALYEASQRQRSLERKVRAAGRRAATAMSPEARMRAKRDLAAARAASAAHRAAYGSKMSAHDAWIREHPFRAH